LQNTYGIVFLIAWYLKYKVDKPQSRFACGVSLSNAAHVSQSPQSNTPGSSQSVAGRLFNGLTANDRWHGIYRSKQRSLSLGKGLMLAETVAQTDGQTLPIIIYRYISD